MTNITFVEPRWIPNLSSRLGLGLSRVGSMTGGARPIDAVTLIRGALDVGVNLFDTADIYGQGGSECALGRALSGHRDAAIICTKGGYRMSGKLRLAARLKPVLKPLLSAMARKSPGSGTSLQAARASALSQDFSPERIVRSLDASLRRLRTDRIDLFMLHSPDPTFDLVPALEALARARDAGKIVAVGVSVRDPADAQRILELPTIDAIQLRWSPAVGPSPDVIAAARRHGVVLIAREVLAGRHFAAPAERNAALAEPIANGADCILSGTSSLAHLRENLSAVRA